jgi:hypothetical protein
MRAASRLQRLFSAAAGAPRAAGMPTVPISAGPSERYMRALPPTCVDWASAEGRKLFREALAAGDMENYFPLAAQFTTQAEPSYCGLGTLAMVLNALNIDPGRVWKGTWRWYHEAMLDCCVPLEVVRDQGISMDTFACLARCNGAAATLTRAGDNTLPAFRSAILAAVRSRAGAFLVASYSRSALGQTGSGHFSPIAGYHAASDSVLVLDVARFKYPPHWVSVERLWAAMQDVDPATELARGWVAVHRSAAVPLVLFALGSGSTLTGCPTTAGEGGCGNCSGQGRGIGSAAMELATIARDIDSAALPGAGVSADADAAAALRVAVGQLLGDGKEARALLALSAAGDGLALTDDATCLTRLSREQVAAAAALLLDVEQLPLFQLVREALAAEGKRRAGGRGAAADGDATVATLLAVPAAEEGPSDVERAPASACSHEPLSCVRVHTAHVLTTLLLTMYGGREEAGARTSGRVGAALRDVVLQSLSASSELVQAEVSLLRGQLTTLS